MSLPLHVIILAAGQGSRMKSKLPKVLHPLAGKPMLHHVIDTARQLSADGIHVVIGHGAEKVRDSVKEEDIFWVMQSEQLGTGHAVAQALPGVPEDARVLVLYGDVPLILSETLSGLLEHVSTENMALLTVELDDPQGYGRIIRNDAGQVEAIVEQKDATSDQLAITEVNTGILAATGRQMKTWLPALSSDNAQGEYYLTDVIAMAAREATGIAVAQPRTEQEVQGVNNRQQLAELERYYQKEQANSLMAQGVTLADPARLDIRGSLTTESDVFVDVGVVFEGKVSLAEGVHIGPYCFIRDAIIGPGSRIESHCSIERTVIANNCTVGPFARLRPGTLMKNGAKVGNFVETKKAVIGEGSKVNHLSYLGDTQMGDNVNIGAGTITCNYDGVNKYETLIGDGAFVGSNTSLVAPVTVGAGATIGAGSTITAAVGDSELAIARGKQRNIEGWKRPTKKSSPE